MSADWQLPMSTSAHKTYMSIILEPFFPAQGTLDLSVRTKTRHLHDLLDFGLWCRHGLLSYFSS